MVIASNGGSRSHPAWYYNLRAHPEVAVELGNERFRVVAEELGFGARSSVWPTIVEQSPAHSRRLKGSEE
jgi:deazaflavin-dependent oxidoreductase (nitroreductase family)